jgi:hypothetical protein
MRVSASLGAIGDAISLSGGNGGSHGGLHQSVYGRVPRNLESTDQGPRGGYASIAFPQRLGQLFSPAAKGRHSSRDKKAVCRRPPLRCGPDGCGPIAPRAKDRHRGCDWRGPTTDGDHHGYHRHLHRGGQRLRLRPWKCPLATCFVMLARRRPGQAFPQQSEDNA